MISTKLHGYLDYLVGAILIFSPLILNLPEGAASTVPVVLGAGTIVYSLLTDYEMGLLKILAMKVHLLIDIVAGIFLAVSPWLFGFADEVYLPHVIFGIIEIGAASFTAKKTSYPEVPKP